jgi:hypothetical protein
MNRTTSAPCRQLEETPVVQRLREQSFNRAIAYSDHRDAVSDHHVVRGELLDDIERVLIEEPTPDLLSELRGFGLLWSVVAQAIGVSDAAIRKWRRGQSIEHAHRRRLARLVALGRLHRTYAMPTTSTSFAEWMDTRVVRGFSATPLDLLALNRQRDSGALQPLLDWMLEHPDGDHGEALLDRYLGHAWREEAQEEQRFRIVRSARGDRVLVIDA